MITIITMTWKEMIRKRVMLLSLIMTAIFLVAFWYVARAITQDNTTILDPSNISRMIQRFEHGAILLSLGTFFGSFVVAFLSIFSAVGVIAGEAEQGVLQALLPRPIPRWRWYLGRWIGYVSMGIVYAALLMGSILAITCTHALVPNSLGIILQSFALFAWVVPILVSVSMVGSCFFSALGNGVFMVMLYGAGSLGGMIEKIIGIRLFNSMDSSHSLQTISGLLSIIMPADSLQRRMLADLFSLQEIQDLTNLNQFLGPFGVYQVPSNTFLVYTLVYMLAALAIGIAAFQRKDL